MENKSDNLENALSAIQKARETYEQMREELELAKKENELFYMHMQNENSRQSKVLNINDYRKNKNSKWVFLYRFYVL